MKGFRHASISGSITGLGVLTQGEYFEEDMLQNVVTDESVHEYFVITFGFHHISTVLNFIPWRMWTES
jgi:hypothetical protein